MIVIARQDNGRTLLLEGVTRVSLVRPLQVMTEPAQNLGVVSKGVVRAATTLDVEAVVTATPDPGLDLPQGQARYLQVDAFLGEIAGVAVTVTDGDDAPVRDLFLGTWITDHNIPDNRPVRLSFVQARIAVRRTVEGAREQRRSAPRAQARSGAAPEQNRGPVATRRKAILAQAVDGAAALIGGG